MRIAQQHEKPGDERPADAELNGIRRERLMDGEVQDSHDRRNRYRYNFGDIERGEHVLGERAGYGFSRGYLFCRLFCLVCVGVAHAVLLEIQGIENQQGVRQQTGQ